MPLSIVGIVSPAFTAGPGPNCPTTNTPVAGSGGTAGGNGEIAATIQVNAALAIATDLTNFSQSSTADAPDGTTAIDFTHIVTTAMDEWPSRPEKAQTLLIATTGQRLIHRPAISGYFTLTITNPGSSVITVATVQVNFYDASGT